MVYFVRPRDAACPCRAPQIQTLTASSLKELTEREECAFDEMMVHLPLYSHSYPKHVLIVGGGNGVCLREVCRHTEVQQVTLVEIDPMVLQASKDF